jgi:hypothetical protein
MSKKDSQSLVNKMLQNQVVMERRSKSEQQNLLFLVHENFAGCRQLF